MVRSSPCLDTRLTFDRYVKTTIITDSLGEAVEKSGAGFATLEDTGQVLLRIVSDSTVHGKALGTPNKQS